MAGTQKVNESYISDAVVNVPPIVDVYDETTGSSNKDFVVPDNEMWKINYVYIELSTSATVGDRNLDVLVTNPALKTIFSSDAGVVVPAGATTQAFLYMPGAPRETTIVEGQAHVGIPNDLYVMGGNTFTVFDNAEIDPAGDDMIVGFQYQKFTI
jgi:hypothetical protein